MEQVENEAENRSGDHKRKAYSKPRLQVFGDLRTIVHGGGNPTPLQSDGPVQHMKSS
jgi:hypothetical protein